MNVCVFVCVCVQMKIDLMWWLCAWLKMDTK